MHNLPTGVSISTAVNPTNYFNIILYLIRIIQKNILENDNIINL